MRPNTRPIGEPKDHVANIEREIYVGLGGDEDDPVADPGNRHKESKKHQHPADGNENSEGNMLPLHDYFTRIMKVAVTGSCCGSVAFLLLVSGWDHGWIPGLKSQFALASDLKEFENQGTLQRSDLNRLLVLSLAQAIRNVEEEICIDDTNVKREQLESLQYDYFMRTGARYPLTGCPAE